MNLMRILASTRQKSNINENLLRKIELYLLVWFLFLTGETVSAESAPGSCFIVKPSRH